MHTVGLSAVPEIGVCWGLGKLEMEVLSPRPLSFEFPLSRNTKLGHVKERYVIFLNFFSFLMQEIQRDLYDICYM